MSEGGPELVAVHFRAVARLRRGETLVVVGSAPALGSDDFKYGVRMHTTPRTYPEWASKSSAPLASGTRVLYRYAVLSGGDFCRWEASEPRELFVRAPESATELEVVDEVQTGVEEDDQEKKQDRGANATIETQGATPVAMRRRRFVQQRGSKSGESVERDATGSFRGSKRSLDLERDDGIFIVSYFLPVSISRVEAESHFADGVSYENRADPARERTRDGSATAQELTRHVETVPENAPVPHETRSRSFRRKSSSNSTEESEASIDQSDSESSARRLWHVEWDESALLSRKKSSVADSMRIVYVGIPRVKSPVQAHERESLVAVLAKFRCVPVFVPEYDKEMHHLFCYDTLRKLFHHQIDVYGPLPTRWWNGAMHESSWSSYRTVNQAFAEICVQEYEDGDLIWVHGHELLLLPSLLARRLQAGKPHIGLFIHAPFPSSEIFRTLSMRDDLLRGILNADQIGFHLYEYARPFISCCHRILGIPHDGNENDRHGVLQVDYQGRKVLITVCHGGIEHELVRAKVSSSAVMEKASKLLEACKVKSNVSTTNEQVPTEDQIIIVGMDDAEMLRGVHFKLVAYEQLLHEENAKGNSIWCDRLCLLQVLVNPKRDTEESNEVRSLVRKIARRINKEFSRKPGRRPAVMLMEWKSQSFEDRIALYSISDLLMGAPLRAGLDLQGFEFMIATDERKRVFNGPWRANLEVADPILRDIRENPVLVLSEFTAAFRVLPGSLSCNPWRQDEVVETLLSALTMGSLERKARYSAALKYVVNHNETGWAQRVLTDIKSARPVSQDVVKMPPGTTPSGLGFGLQFTVIEFRPNFQKLTDEMLIQAYRDSGSRLIVLDYGGTVVDERSARDEAHYDDTEDSDSVPQTNFSFKFGRPSSRMLRALRKIVQDPVNTVFIVSGRDRRELEAAFADVPEIGLCAEHGCFFSIPSRGKTTSEEKRTVTPPLVSSSGDVLPKPRRLFENKIRSSSIDSVEPEARDVQETLTRDWITLSDVFDSSWMDLSEQIMDVYTQRTDGTIIERKGSSIVWQFRDAEPEFGRLQASELQDHLHGVLKAYPIEVVRGKDYVEVCPQGIDKGNAVAHIVDMMDWRPHNLPDFVLCVGDDIADEAMFEFFHQLKAGSGNGHHNVSRNRESVFGSSSQMLADSILGRDRISTAGVEQGEEDEDIESLRSTEEVISRGNNWKGELFTCVVGEKPSVAQYYVNDVSMVRNLLEVLGRLSTKWPFSRSLGDVRGSRGDVVADPARKTFDSYGSLRLEGRANSKTVSSIRESHEGDPANERGGPEDSVGAADEDDLTDEEITSAAEGALNAAKTNRSFVDLRLRDGRMEDENDKGGQDPDDSKRRMKVISSASMPALSEYFSLDISQPVSTSYKEYEDKFADDIVPSF